MRVAISILEMEISGRETQQVQLRCATIKQPDTTEQCYSYPTVNPWNWRGKKFIQASNLGGIK